VRDPSHANQRLRENRLIEPVNQPTDAILLRRCPLCRDNQALSWPFSHVDMRFLLEGRPGVGKTTVARRLAALLKAHGEAVTGFTTAEIRRGRRREGFAVETVSGQRGILAHVEFPGAPRVGRYGVDLAAFERIVLPMFEEVPASGVVVIDELGKMELASAPFRAAVTRLFEEEVSLVATIHVFKDDFTDALKRRRDVEVVKVSASNRDSLPEEIVARLLPN
jgi:nucleoside-triphosphatase